MTCKVSPNCQTTKFDSSEAVVSYPTRPQLNRRVIKELIRHVWRYIRPTDAYRTPSNVGGTLVQSVGVDAAMSYSAVYACVRILSTNIASLPLELYRTTDQGQVLDTKSSYHRMLTFEPNKKMNMAQFIQAVVSQMLLFGNSYGRITYVAGKPASISLLAPERITIKDDDNASGLIYQYSTVGGTVDYTADDIIHFKNVSTNGLYGVTPLSVLRSSVALGTSSIGYANKLYQNNARPSGLLVNKAPGKMSPDDYSRITTAWDSQTAGDNVGRTAILPSDLEYKPMSMNLVDVEFIKSHQLSNATIAQCYGVPLFLLQADQNPVYAGLSEATRTFRDFVLRPLMDQITGALNYKIFGYKSPYSVQFNTDKLLSNDLASRYKAYESALNGQQWLTVNEVRQQEGWNLLAEPEADQLNRPAK